MLPSLELPSDLQSVATDRLRDVVERGFRALLAWSREVRRGALARMSPGPTVSAGTYHARRGEIVHVYAETDVRIIVPPAGPDTAGEMIVINSRGPGTVILESPRGTTLGGVQTRSVSGAQLLISSGYGDWAHFDGH